LKPPNFRDLVAAGRLTWHDIIELGDIVTGKAAGRRGPADITLFKSLGIALEDIAFADLIVRPRPQGRRRQADAVIANTVNCRRIA